MSDEFEERRAIPTTIEQGRRVTEKVAVLEARVDFHEQRITDNERLTTRLIEKLDEHIVLNTERDVEIQRNLANITGAVTNLSSVVAETNETLRGISQLAQQSNTKWIKLDTMWATLTKIGTIAVIIIGAIWTAGTYFAERAEQEYHDNKAQSQSQRK